MSKPWPQYTYETVNEWHAAKQELTVFLKFDGALVDNDLANIRSNRAMALTPKFVWSLRPKKVRRRS